MMIDVYELEMSLLEAYECINDYLKSHEILRSEERELASLASDLYRTIHCVIPDLTPEEPGDGCDYEDFDLDQQDGEPTP